MKLSKQEHSPPFWTRCLVLATIAGGGLLFGAAPVLAIDNCIQDVWQAHGNNQGLTCTAQDVTLSQVTNIDITAGGQCAPEVPGGPEVCKCNLGGNVTFTADFQMDLTADTRYDTGFYIASDDDPNGDGALTGTCSATGITAANAPVTFKNLDAAPDVCGDITGPLGTAFNPQIVHFTLTQPCTDEDGNGQLDLDFCTTWRQPGSNEVCDGIGNGLATNDVFPGSPSKCNCDTLAIPIFFETASLEVTKTPLAPATVPETGGSATFSVTVKNLATVVSVTLDTFEDLVPSPSGTNIIYGDLLAAPVAPITANTCDDNLPIVIAAGQTFSCTFTATIPPGDKGQTKTDTVQACGTDSQFHTGLCDHDDATVTYTDVQEPPTLSKTASATTCQVDATYDVLVTNGSAQDKLTLNTLTDDIYGVITSTHAAGGGFGQVVSTNCGLGGEGNPGTLPAEIAASGQYSCSFVGRITTCDSTTVDTVTGSATDDDGATYDGTSTPPFEDDATVTVSTTP